MNRLKSQAVQEQRGAALVVVLLLLIVITLLGLASMRDTLMQERMAAYTIARGYAFQAAETALREAEDFARGKPAVPTDGTCLNGVCAARLGGAKPLYESDSAFWDTEGNYRTASQATNGITPRYTIEGFGTRYGTAGSGPECLGDNCGPGSSAPASVYRITVRSRADNGTEVMLQSLFQAP